jgi:Tol biopolymer transport system component
VVHRALALAAAFMVACSAFPMASAQTVELVSVAADGTPADGPCSAPSLSADGNLVVFESLADNLVPGDTNGKRDIFLRDRVAQTTRRISVDSSGAEANGDSFNPEVSGDGRFVVFRSFASNLTSWGAGGHSHIFVHELATGVTTHESRSATAIGDGDSVEPHLSADGRFVVFASLAKNLVTGDTNNYSDVFLRDRIADSIVRVSVEPNGKQGVYASIYPSISGNGSHVAFATPLAYGDPNDTVDHMDVVIRDLATGTYTSVSVATYGTYGNDDSIKPVVSNDGTRVLFLSKASNFIPGDTAYRSEDAFVRDLVAGTTSAVNVDSDGRFFDEQSNAHLWHATLSSDGRCAAFDTILPILPDDAWDGIDVYLRDLETPLTTRQSLAFDLSPGDGDSTEGALDFDGSSVAFASLATNLVPGGTDGQKLIFVRDRPMADATWSNYGAGWPGTRGIPNLSAAADPVLNRVLTLQVGNSYGRWTYAVLFGGFDAVQWPTGFGGDLLVDPIVVIDLPVGPNGGTFPSELPDDEVLVGLTLRAQVLEIDPGASDGISFTDGIELVLGY